MMVLCVSSPGLQRRSGHQRGKGTEGGSGFSGPARDPGAVRTGGESTINPLQFREGEFESKGGFHGKGSWSLTGGSSRLQLTLVALNQPHSGDMMGLDMVDRMCYEQAKAMGLAPHYRAFISSHKQDLVHVVYPGFREALPVTNLRGDVMFWNWRSIFSGNGGSFSPRIPIYSFDGRDVLSDPFWPKKSIWHGSTSRGLRMVDKHCETWRADNLSVTGQSSSLTSGLLLGQQTRSCSNEFIVLCIETHKNL
uniref:Collagenase NC10/endostatin domain-containing protein n=1 Tax=Oryzias melastigma TaxID=30732 RepID=A0A3B3B560_ORYME